MDETTTTTGSPASSAAGSPTGEQAPPAAGPRVTRDEVKDLSRLRRSVTDRHVAGVAGGLARHLDVDPIIVRVVLVVAIFFGGAGLLAYIGAWVLVPEEGTDDQPLGLDQRNRSIALAGVGVLAVLSAVGDWAGASWFSWPLAVLAVVVAWFLHRKGRSATADPWAAPAFGPPAAAAPTHPEAGPADPTYADPASAASTYADPTYADPTYADPAGGVPGGPGQWATYARPPRPRHPRKRGPILFFFTLALIALAEGVLGVVDLAGAHVVDSAYPALALGTVAVMLLVGAFWGRAGGLVLLGLVAAVATGATSVGEDVRDTRVEHAPTTASAVRDSYDFGGGTFTLDLSGVADVEALDGHDIDISGVGGRIVVVVPDGMDVDVTSSIVGGHSEVFGRSSDGFDVTRDGSLDGGAGAPDLSINIDLVGGEILVRDAA
ncbi:PspC domain-containing protein [Nocardioides zeicaulis]|uniref:PspC domain-containing protein n=1 Tax=Nocardioides zeicaulis TaxID=1776857 RepID=A0ABV6E6D3_9ACTN